MDLDDGCPLFLFSEHPPKPASFTLPPPASPDRLSDHALASIASAPGLVSVDESPFKDFIGFLGRVCFSGEISLFKDRFSNDALTSVDSILDPASNDDFSFGVLINFSAELSLPTPLRPSLTDPSKLILHQSYGGCFQVRL